ncbi:CHAT domain-containing protein [Spirulina major CS-329]|nr:CHAT domain-containing protein [Spirulina subsalsa]MDB9494771.1 CHAT domain-containing protein [Spirulina subsalsa CS-330]MDB9503893.1 CHAT domain-containing protein [Spirulina major CS-329]
MALFRPTNHEDLAVFLPQSSLFLAPFPAPMDANGDYLIEKHTILTAPSIQTLALTRSPQL